MLPVINLQQFCMVNPHTTIWIKMIPTKSRKFPFDNYNKIDYLSTITLSARLHGIERRQDGMVFGIFSSLFLQASHKTKFHAALSLLSDRLNFLSVWNLPQAAQMPVIISIYNTLHCYRILDRI
jgi:hypothetical protein